MTIQRGSQKKEEEDDVYNFHRITIGGWCTRRTQNIPEFVVFYNNWGFYLEFFEEGLALFSRDGKRTGRGMFTWPSGEKYEGEFKDGYRNGQGSYTWFSDEKYEGEFKDGYRNGQGTYTWSNGKKYIGKWKNGEINGLGTFTRVKGDYERGRYVGQWKSGYKHGQGTYTYPKGSKYVGEYNDGNRWNGTEYDEDGTIIRKYVNGVITEINP